jgi:hypothetical protein
MNTEINRSVRIERTENNIVRVIIPHDSGCGAWFVDVGGENNSQGVTPEHIEETLNKIFTMFETLELKRNSREFRRCAGMIASDYRQALGGHEFPSYDGSCNI